MKEKIKQISYVYKHKPTGNWVRIQYVPCYHEPDGHFYNLTLEPEIDNASFYSSKEHMQSELVKCEFNGNQNYCVHNFLEFEAYEVKTKNVIEEASLVKVNNKIEETAYVVFSKEEKMWVGKQLGVDDSGKVLLDHFAKIERAFEYREVPPILKDKEKFEIWKVKKTYTLEQ